MLKELIERRAGAVPRYTSYPTAPHFNPQVDAQTYASWLAKVPADARVSLYVHIPFCDRLCWFCGCNTKQTNRYAPVEAYLEVLYKEIAAVGGHLAKGVTIDAIHFGGGSPTMLEPADIVKLNGVLRQHFQFAQDAEFSVEIDPNDMTEPRFDAFAAAGMTRASLGVQDFDPVVQTAINREQTFEQTKTVVDGARKRGVHSVNLDVLYGLPHQTVRSVEDTVRQCLSLDPDRIALFGYAHVPWMKTHQKMIDESVLPDAVERFEQQETAAALLAAAGYEPVGMDHFAKPSDGLAKAAQNGKLRRNFQGYTDDVAAVLIGLGTSAIGELPQGYVQNAPATGDYKRRIEETGLAAVRGFAISEDDVMRRALIGKLMCEFGFTRQWLEDEFGPRSKVLIEEANYLAVSDPDELFAREGDTYIVTEKGRPFVRVVAAAFDAYLSTGKARHSAAV